MAPVAISAPGGMDVASSRHKAKSAPATAMPSPPAAAAVMPHASTDFMNPTDPAAEPADPTVKPAAPKVRPHVDIPARRPSPWHDLAHSLSTTALPHYRSSNLVAGPSASSASLVGADPRTQLAGAHGSSPGPSPPLSTSQALREWENRLSQPSSSYSRHTLIPPPTPPSPSPELYPTATTALVPKLAPESDKHGHIEYKLKLINPPAERFERLVTQMMWRLKQGRNEAIYELGLADDGTVVGLSRTDMDASLRTLELMASEVGATVLVLKEIVLAKSVLDLARIDSVASTGSASWSSRDDSPAGWVVPRRTSWAAPGPKERDGLIATDRSGLDEGADVPRSKNKKVKKKKSWKRRERRGLWPNDNAGQEGSVSKERQIVFDLPTGSEGELSADDEDIIEVSEERRARRLDRPSHTTKPVATAQDGTRSDDDVPPFHLDLEDAPNTTPAGDRWTSRRAKVKARGQTRNPNPNQLPPHESACKLNAKARKAMERREARRLSLLRGDGMTPSPFDLLDDAVEDSAAGISPHAPSRPSSLRLVPPAPITHPPAEIKNDQMEEEEESAVIQDLLSLPLDSLSLSFADVRTVAASPPLSPTSSSSTEYAPTMYTRNTEDDEDGTDGLDSGDERICVEALVVRKVLHEEDEEAWGWGGDDDGWGLSAERADAEETDKSGVLVQPKNRVEDEVDEGDDPWGFG